ncbi:hypothetical protein SLA2020_528650 [Shorea laevis]
MDQLISFIIRPPRAEYNPEHDLLEQEFMLRGKWYQRKDIEIKNSRGDVLQCCHYMPIASPEGKSLPCVIYCHGNSGCRADASEAAIILLPSNITVFALDFSGSGLSGGEHVTLGWNEKDDLKAVVDYLRSDGNVSFIGLWGRSMGAVTSLMYGAEDPSIAGMVLDSPFSNLVDLMMELVDTYKYPLPKFTVKFAIQYMRKAIQKKAKFDIMDLNTLKLAKSCFVPVLFGHAIDDDFIRPHHSDKIFEAYVGDKNIIKFEGDHNSPRPQFYFDSLNIFFHNVLQPPEDEVGPTFYEPMLDYFGKGTWTEPDIGFLPSSTLSKVAEPGASSTVDAIKEVRSKRPMSRMEVPSDILAKDNRSESEDKDESDDHGSSSSNMISFELSNGNPYGPHVPTKMDDDQYVEYELDDLEGFPCSAEEEERMFMEAVLESLKDMNLQRPQTEEQNNGTDSSESLQKDNVNSLNASSTTEQQGPSKSESASTLVECQSPETVTTAITNGPKIASEQISHDSSASSVGPVSDTQSTIESGSAGSSSLSDTSANIQSSSDVDMLVNTKATLTVERNPTNNIMDGLMRRWDLNFFRNGR